MLGDSPCFIPVFSVYRHQSEKGFHLFGKKAPDLCLWSQDGQSDRAAYFISSADEASPLPLSRRAAHATAQPARLIPPGFETALPAFLAALPTHSCQRKGFLKVQRQPLSCPPGTGCADSPPQLEWPQPIVTLASFQASGLFFFPPLS